MEHLKDNVYFRHKFFFSDKKVESKNISGNCDKTTQRFFYS